MTEKQGTNEIATINEQIASTEAAIRKAYAEAKEHAEKRDKLNEQGRKLRQEIDALEKERDSLNIRVKTLKQHRDEARTKSHPIIEKIREHRQKIIDLKEKAPRRSRAQVQKELEDIEWKIQTTSMDMQEEKKLMVDVKQLEIQLNAHKKIEKQNEKILELKKELETLKKEADAAHQELTATAQKSQEIHANMIAKINEAKNLKAEADRLHAAYVQAKEQTKPLYEEIRRLVEQKQGLTEQKRKLRVEEENLQKSMRDEDIKKKKETEKELKEKLGSQAKDKLQRGEKLSWDEFQLLADEDAENSESQD